jgi:hypothetical protein
MRLLLHENQLTLSITKREHDKLEVGLNYLDNGLIKVLFQDMMKVHIQHHRNLAVEDYTDKSKRFNFDLNWNE